MNAVMNMTANACFTGAGWSSVSKLVKIIMVTIIVDVIVGAKEAIVEVSPCNIVDMTNGH